MAYDEGLTGDDEQDTILGGAVIGGLIGGSTGVGVGAAAGAASSNARSGNASSAADGTMERATHQSATTRSPDKLGNTGKETDINDANSDETTDTPDKTAGKTT